MINLNQDEREDNLMNKIKILLLALALFTIGGCGNAQATTNEKDSLDSATKMEDSSMLEDTENSKDTKNTEDYEALSIAYLEQIRAEKYDDITQNLSKEFLEQLPPETLIQTLKAVYTSLGDYQEIVNQNTTVAQGNTVVTIEEKYTQNNLISTFVYDAQGQICGFNVNYNKKIEVYQPESTEKYEEISIKVGNGDEKLDGILTLPRDVEKPPVIVMVQGSGPNDLNETIGTAKNRPFADIAHGLAENGVATIRFNKRYYQYPPMDIVGITVESEVIDDVNAAIQLAATDDRVDTNQVYLLGHSLGGMLAPRISKENPEIKGLISMAGSLRKLHEISRDQNKALLDMDTKLSAEQKQEALAQADAEYKKIDALTEENLSDTVLGQPASYWYSLNRVDDAAIAKELSIPMLILQGENDFQVYVEKDFALWQETLAGKENVSFHVYPGLSHLFMPAPDNTMNVELYNIPANVDSQVIQDIADWIHSLS